MEEIKQPINIPPQNQPQEPVIPTNEVIPYNLDNILADRCSARIISPAYSGRNSELTAVLQYMFQSMIFQNLGYGDIANQIERIALEEMQHFELLGKTLLRLGVTPIYTAYPPIRDNYFNTRFINYVANPRQMLLADILGEQQAINMYNNMLSRLTNQEVRNVIQYILAEEQQHLIILNQLLASLNA